MRVVQTDAGRWYCKGRYYGSLIEVARATGGKIDALASERWLDLLTIATAAMQYSHRSEIVRVARDFVDAVGYPTARKWIERGVIDLDLVAEIERGRVQERIEAACQKLFCPVF